MATATTQRRKASTKTPHSIAALPENLRRIRGDRPQTEVAAKVGITQSQLSKIERGAVVPKIEMLIRLAAVLDVEPGDLTRLVA